jgi:hypothetical protein
MDDGCGFVFLVGIITGASFTLIVLLLMGSAGIDPDHWK